MVRLSERTADEMEGRGILLSYIEAALASPDRVGQDMTDPALSRSYKAIPELGNRVLRVVYRRDGDDIFVVTAHWDRGGEAVIRTNYDPEADVLHIAFGPQGVPSDTSEEVAPGVFVEFDPNGNPIGIEVISVRRRSGQIAPVKTAAK